MKPTGLNDMATTTFERCVIVVRTLLFLLEAFQLRCGF